MQIKLWLRCFLVAGCAFLTVACWAQGDSVGIAPNREMAITFDDLPASESAALDDESLADLNRRLLAHIAGQGIPVIGFVNEGKLYHEGQLVPARVDVLKDWLAAGIELGNHGFSHLDLHRVELSVYLDDIARGEVQTRKLLAERGMTLRYFRHPFLHTGRDLETRKKVMDYLAEHGYTVAPVTFDNAEWIFAGAYGRALTDGDSEMATRVGQAYLKYMDEKLAYFERQSVAFFGREIPQILLVHANRLNAEYFGALVERIRRRGYRFVSMAHVIEDPAFQSEDRFVGAGGISWLHRWAWTAGKRAAFFAGEPEAPAFVMKQAGVDSE